MYVTTARLRSWGWIALGGSLLVVVAIATINWFVDEGPPDLSDLPASGLQGEFGDAGFVLLERAIAEISIPQSWWEKWNTSPQKTRIEDYGHEAEDVLRRNAQARELLAELEAQPRVTPSSGRSRFYDRGTVDVFHLQLIEIALRTETGDFSDAVRIVLRGRRLGEQLIAGAREPRDFEHGLHILWRSNQILESCIRHPRATGEAMALVRRYEKHRPRSDHSFLLRTLPALIENSQRQIEQYPREFEQEYGWPLKPNRAMRRACDAIRRLAVLEGRTTPALDPSITWTDCYSEVFSPSPWAWLTGNSASEKLARQSVNKYRTAALAWRNYQANRSLLLLASAMRRFHLEHGVVPEDLDELVPAYLEEIPIDPYGGRPLWYFPEHKAIYSVGEDASLGPESRDNLSFQLVFPRR